MLDCSSLLHLLHVLTLVHPFLSLVLHSRDREGGVSGMRGEWVELRFRCWEISPFRADMWATSHKWKIAHSPFNLLSLHFYRPIELVDSPVILCFGKIELKIGDIDIGANLKVQYTMYHSEIDIVP